MYFYEYPRPCMLVCACAHKYTCSKADMAMYINIHIKISREMLMHTYIKYEEKEILFFH